MSVPGLEQSGDENIVIRCSTLVRMQCMSTRAIADTSPGMRLGGCFAKKNDPQQVPLARAMFTRSNPQLGDCVEALSAFQADSKG